MCPNRIYIYIQEIVQLEPPPQSAFFPKSMNYVEKFNIHFKKKINIYREIYKYIFIYLFLPWSISCQKQRKIIFFNTL